MCQFNKMIYTSQLANQISCLLMAIIRFAARSKIICWRANMRELSCIIGSKPLLNRTLSRRQSQQNGSLGTLVAGTLQIKGLQPNRPALQTNMIGADQ
jgi:hypothetical protein